MSDQILFSIVFLAQILLISYYLPGKMLRRMTYVLETYPPSAYAKLYPKPIAYYDKALRNFKAMNGFILLAGLLLLAAMYVYSTTGEWDVVFPYFMVQFIPIMILEMGTFKIYRLMRKASTIRKAELQPRRLFYFVAPKMIGLMLFVYLAFIVFAVYISAFDLPWFSAFENIAILTGMNLFLTGIILWNIYGKKQDPYQAYEDRKKHIAHLVRSMVFVSIAATLFNMINSVFSAWDMRHLEPTITSLYFQIIAVVGLRAIRIDNIDFEVYKTDPILDNQAEKNQLIEEETTDYEKSKHIYKMVGVSFGLAFGIALAFNEGATIKGIMLIGGVGGGVGLFLGIALSLWVSHLRTGDSSMT
jgi:uncharacterized membrane protein (DUF485 family)